MSQLSDFVLNFCREVGGIVEPPAYGVSAVLLPDEVARRLQIEPYQHLAFDDTPATEDSQPGQPTLLYYGHPLVERMLEDVRRRPASVRMAVTGLRLEKRGLAEAARQALACPNGHLAAAPHAEETPALGHYVRFNFKASLVTDEKHEQLTSVLMHVQGGYAVLEQTAPEEVAVLQPELPPDAAHLPVVPLAWLPGRRDERDGPPLLPAGSGDPLSEAVMAGLLERAQTAACVDLAAPLETLGHRAARHLELDRARLEQYYADLQHDLERRVARADEERRAGLLGKLHALQLERQNKLLDVEAKYALRLTLELINASVIVQPKIVLPMCLENRSVTVTRWAAWDPLLHRIEPWVCDACGLPSYRLYLCSGGHLAHKECLAPQCVDCKRIYCQLCSQEMQTCAVCQRPVCVHSLNRCDTCGRGTCREHRGLCHADNGQPARLTPAVAEPAPAPAAVPPSPEPAKPEKRQKAPKAAAAPKVGAAAALRRKASRQQAVGQRIEVYAEASLPVIRAWVFGAKRELAVRSWELMAEGIHIQCECEKGIDCGRTGLLMRPAPPDRIEVQMQAEIDLLRQEYQVPAKRVSFFYVVNDMARPEHRLLLRGHWKEGTWLSLARQGFERHVGWR